MGLADVTDKQAVLKALTEFDQIGREKFLSKYGFGHALEYFVESDGKRYDSKAIIGAAHGYQHGEALSNSFSGGEAQVAKRLENLGFAVTRPTRLPDWTMDELILALDLYMKTRGKITFGPGRPEVIGLSKELRSLGIHPPEVTERPRFRNPDGVALKLHNFAALDPAVPGTGMNHGARADALAWDTWANRPDELALVVQAIRTRTQSDNVPPPTDEEDEYEAEEGRILYREHRRYERDKKLVANKKREALAATGTLACEVCGFDSGALYGHAVEGVIDVHHKRPLHTLGISVTKLSDLALVCPTCHRVLHKHKPFITPEELKAKRNVTA